MSEQTIGIVGGGAWGTALAQSQCLAGRRVLIWAHEPETVSSINERQCNDGFLPGLALSKNIEATGSLADLAGTRVILLVPPAQHLRRVVKELEPNLVNDAVLVICAKGIEQLSGELMSTVVASEVPRARIAVLSGPSFASDVARGLPTAVTLACQNQAEGEVLANLLGHKAFRTYWTHDVVGAQVGGSIKNVLAIAAGVVEGKQLGQSARAALITRGFAELVRFGEVFRAERSTLNGLSGFGDLVLTCTSSQSRNMSLGYALGEGRALDEVSGERRSIAEGVFTAQAVQAIVHERGLDMPICTAVHKIVAGSITVDEAIDALLSRPLRAETD